MPIILVFLMAGGLAIFIGSMRWLKVNFQIVEFSGLPDHLRGLRILHISDLHSDHLTRKNLDIWPRVGGLDFDIAVITGDIIRGRRRNEPGNSRYLLPHQNSLARLAERVPTFFVEGNHESRIFPEMREFLENIGIIVLYNQRYTLTVGRGDVDIIGTMDYSTMNLRGWGGLRDLLAENHGNFQIMLTHQPQVIDTVKPSGISLVLAGHTHGGQVRLPLLPALYAPNQGLLPRYSHGLYRHGDAQMFVSRGIGTTYFPIRFFNRPEIAIIELRRSGHEF